jgi:hypothetical protein
LKDVCTHIAPQINCLPDNSEGLSHFNPSLNQLASVYKIAIHKGYVNANKLLSNNKLVLAIILYNAMPYTSNVPLALSSSDLERVFRREVKYGVSVYFTTGRKAKQMVRSKGEKSLYYHYLYVLHHIFIYPFVNRKHGRINGTPIHHDTLRKILGRNAGRVLKDLSEWGVIESDQQYIKGEKSFYYKINKEYMEDLRNEVCLNPDIRDRILARRELLQYRSKETLPLLDVNVRKIKINKEAALAKISRVECNNKGEPFENIEASRAAFRNLVCNIESEIFYCIQDGFSGRIHTNLTVLPKFLRPYIEVEGETLVQVDMPTCQPMMLHRLMRKLGYNTKDLFKFKQLIESGKFYEYFSHLFPQEMKRGHMKLTLLIQLFFNKPKTKVPKTTQLFTENFPEVAKFVREVRQPDYKEMPKQLQIEEVDFMMTVVREFSSRYPGVFVSTIHDSLVVKESDGEKALEVMQWMYNRERYNVNLKISSFNE